MPRDANGNYTLPPSFRVQTGDTLLPVQHNPPFEDVAEALTNSLARDGRTVMTGNLQMGGNRVTNVADPALPSDAMTRRVSGFEFETRALAEAWPGVDPMPDSIVIRGDASVDDGMGGTFVLGRASSDVIEVAGESYGRVRDVAPSRIGRARREKWLLTGDWQCIPDPMLGVDDSPQVIMQRDMMDDIEAHHPDCDWAVFAGDLVDRASENNTGAAPLYGFPELIEDMDSRIPSIPRDRWFMLPGNHDRDGTGAEAHQKAWSYKSYREMVGKEFFAIKKGNILQIFMGDQAGSVGGEILDYVADWFKRLVLAHPEYNIVVWMHQPLEGVFTGIDGDWLEPFSTHPRWYQWGSQRFIDVLNAVDNVMFVGTGHVGNTLHRCTISHELYGTTHVNFQMGIPTAYNVGFDLSYGLMFLEDGAETVTIRRWNATTHEYIEGSDLTLTPKFPIQLGGVGLDFDGRFDDDPYFSVIRDEQTIYRSMSDHRVFDDGVWTVPAEIQWMHKLILGDDSVDNVQVGHGVGWAGYLPGAILDTDTADGQQLAGSPAYAFAGGFSIRRVVGNDELDYQSAAEVWVRDSRASGGAVKVSGYWMPESAAGGFGGGYVQEGGRIRAGARGNIEQATIADRTGAQLNSEGDIRASRDSTCMFLQRQNSDGNIASFYRGTTFSGAISVQGATTSYGTSSDATLKEDEGTLTFKEAQAILELITFRNFRWKETGEKDEGVFAQELYEVYPKAVSVGGWFREECGKELRCEKTDAGAFYVPWSVDYSKLVAVIGRCVQGTIERQRKVEEQLASLSSALSTTK